MSQGDRNNDGKLQWALVDWKALEPMVQVLEFGANKYAPHNWRKGLPYTKVCESMLRHIYAFMDGQDKDPESGLHHVGHILCNAMFLSNMVRNRADLDDRYGKCCGKWDENGKCTCDQTLK